MSTGNLQRGRVGAVSKGNPSAMWKPRPAALILLNPQGGLCEKDVDHDDGDDNDDNEKNYRPKGDGMLRRV